MRCQELRFHSKFSIKNELYRLVTHTVYLGINGTRSELCGSESKYCFLLYGRLIERAIWSYNSVFWLVTRAGKISPSCQFMIFSCKVKFFGHIINPLLTKLVRSRCLLFLFFLRFHGPGLRLGPQLANILPSWQYALICVIHGSLFSS